MRKILKILIVIVAITINFACDSNNETIEDCLVTTKSKGPVVLEYYADSLYCVKVGGPCKAIIVIQGIDDDRSIISDNDENETIYHTLRLTSYNHEAGELIDFPEIYFDAKMTGIGIGIFIPEQRAKWIKETDEYILRFIYQ